MINCMSISQKDTVPPGISRIFSGCMTVRIEDISINAVIKRKLRKNSFGISESFFRVNKYASMMPAAGYIIWVLTKAVKSRCFERPYHMMNPIRKVTP